MTRRRTFVLLVLPLALLAAVLFFWARGRRRADVAALFTPAGNLQAVASHRGRVYLFASNLPFRAERGMSMDGTSTDVRTFDDVIVLVQSQLLAPRSVFGFQVGASISGAFATPGKSFGLVVVPHWFLAASCALGPLRWAQLRRRSRRRASRGQCAQCGYDLRGNDTGRCPECGEPARPRSVTSPPAPSPPAPPPAGGSPRSAPG